MKTSRKQILQSGVEKSMSSPEVFPASLFLAPDSERERKMTATSGRKCYERYGRFSPIGLLVKTLLESSQWYNPAVKLRWDVKNLCSERLTEKEYCYDKSMSSKPSVKTLNEKDIPSNRCLFRLVPLERPTEETGCGLLHDLLPTPRAVEVVEHPMKAAARTKDRTGTKLNNLSSGAAFGLLPTPMASDATTGVIIGKNDRFVTTRNGTPRKINQNGQNGSVGLARMVRLLPTPNAREADKYSKKIQSKQSDGNSFDRNGSEWDVTYSDTPRLSALRLPSNTETEGWKDENGQPLQSSSNARGTLLTDWWQNFPTQSPVCRGNDGVPFNVDNLTIPFTKWRQESIKGYGNAIVPQVILEIFKAIEEVEQLE